MSDRITVEEIQEWETLQDDLKKLKDLEMKVRKDIVGRAMSGGVENPKNPNRLKYHGDGFELDLELTTNRSLDKKGVSANYHHMDEVSQSCVVTEYKLVEKEFKNLDPDVDYDIYDYVVERPGAPRLSVKWEDD